ncbi:MAG: linear amide C-N hydrolase [Nitrospirae bacterium]|nr:linear amide C-N hydrolase [Nitrospirota bacterium]
MKVLLSAVAVVLVLLSQSALACTDIQLTAKDGAVLVGRTLEWEGVLKKAPDGTSYLASNLNYAVRAWPAGIKITSTKPDGTAGASWTTKYAYFGFADKGSPDLLLDGQNSAGLSVEALEFAEYANYQDVKPTDKDVIATDDIDSWLLGNFDSVDDIKRELPKMTVWGKPNLAIPLPLKQVPEVHLVVHDKSGKSIIIEYIRKKLHIYDNELKVMTNSPDYTSMSNNSNKYVNLSQGDALRASCDIKGQSDNRNRAGTIGLPGDYSSPSRFVKAAYLVFFGKQPDTAKEGVRSVIHILNNVDIPLGAVREKMSDGNCSMDYTQWKVIKDLKNGIWYIDTFQNIGSIVKIDLNEVFANPGRYLKPVGLTDISYPDVPKINDLLKN